ncbi:hypothetical protein Gotri_003051 [Gossypium trilobum]|uniref:Uncharacterized protein n=1 Tax=Gossypium trilobum TaxID=34281 RepID=A0A7J9FAG7_9ROSI|nr:hypothetical protein [Gossypium trilobum]
MEEIDTVNLRADHVQRWRFCDHSGTLPAGRIVLRVTKDEKKWWRFECCRIEGGIHYISGRVERELICSRDEVYHGFWFSLLNFGLQCNRRPAATVHLSTSSKFTYKSALELNRM